MSWLTTYRRDAVTSPGVGSWAIACLSRAYAPLSPLCEWALWHVTGALFLITCLFAAKLPIILMFRQKLVSNTHHSSFILSYFVIHDHFPLILTAGMQFRLLVLEPISPAPQNSPVHFVHSPHSVKGHSGISQEPSSSSIASSQPN